MTELFDAMSLSIRSMDRAMFVFIAASAYAILASAFVIGTLWCLRGRPALQVPACRRCGALLRGDGDAIPLTCPECGRSLAERNAVRWLRFRRQAATLLVTGPTVVLGGVLLPALLLVGVYSTLERRTEALASTAGLASGSACRSLKTPTPTAVIHRSIEQVQRGGREGVTALAELREALLLAESPNDAGRACLDLLERLVDGDAPHASFVHRVEASEVTVGQMVSNLIHDLARGVPALRERADALAVRLARPTGIRIQPVAVPGEVVAPSLDAPLLPSFSQFILTVEGVSIGDDPSLASTGRDGLLTLPTTEGRFSIAIRWALLRAGGDFAAIDRGTLTTSILVSADPTGIPIIADGAREEDVRLYARLGRVQDHQTLQLSLSDTGAVGLRGHFEVSTGSSWTPILNHDRLLTNAMVGSILLDDPLDPRAPLLIRYVPAFTLESGIVEFPAQSLPGGLNARSDLPKSIRGTVRHFELHGVGGDWLAERQDDWSIQWIRRPR